MGRCIADPASLLPFYFFFFNDTATTEIYTLSLHDALPISHWRHREGRRSSPATSRGIGRRKVAGDDRSPERRSEEHTSELQSQSNLVCRLLLEKKKKQKNMRLNEIHAHSILI